MLEIEAKIEGEYDPEEEEKAREITGEAREEKVIDGASKIDKKSWRKILKMILKTLLIAEHDHETSQKWGDVCKSRLQNCVVDKKQLLEFAEDLERETKMFYWGACLFVEDDASKEKKANKIEYAAYQIFYQNCSERHAWAEFSYSTKNNSKGVLQKIAKRLRNENRTMGSAAQDLPAVTVCPIRKAKTATKTTRLTTTKGNFAKTTQIEEPVTDDEAEKPPQKKKKSAKEEDPILTDDDDKPVAAVMPRRTAEEKFEFQKAIGDLAQVMREQFQQVQQRLQQQESSLETASQGERRGRGGYSRGGYNRNSYSSYGRERYRGRGGYGNSYDRRRSNENEMSSQNSQPQQSNQNPFSTPQIAYSAPQIAYSTQIPFSAAQIPYPAPLMLTSSNAQAQQTTPLRPQQTAPVAAVQPTRQSEGQNKLCRFNPCIYSTCTFRHEEGQRRCKYRPCLLKTCKMFHDPGQQHPDENAFRRIESFRAENKCRWNHDGTCDNSGVRKCQRIHGKDTKSNEQCEHAGRGMCLDFFSPKGCAKSHRRAPTRGGL